MTLDICFMEHEMNGATMREQCSDEPKLCPHKKNINYH